MNPITLFTRNFPIALAALLLTCLTGLPESQAGPAHGSGGQFNFVREEFRIGRSPSRQSLKPGQAWTCINYIGNEPGASFDHPAEFEFSNYPRDPLFMLNGGDPTWKTDDICSWEFDAINNSMGEFTCNSSDNSQTQTIRVRANGDLLVERVVNRGSYGTYPIPSIVDKHRSVVAYELCRTRF